VAIGNRKDLTASGVVVASGGVLGLGKTLEPSGQLKDGQYTTVPVDTCTQGLKRVDVAELYDTENYRPRVSHLLGKPMFLY